MMQKQLESNYQIILRAQSGDRQAFSALFEQYKNLVFRSAFLLLGNTQDAEDALQEVFVLVYKSLNAFDARKGAFSTWLHRITINHCLNHRRKRILSPVPLEEFESIGEFPEKNRADNEDIWQAVQKLSEKLKVVVILRYYWDLSYAEIAQVLEIPLGTVKSRLDMAIKTFRLVLEKQEALSGLSPEVEVRNEM